MDRVDQAITDISVQLIDAHLEPEERFRAIRARADAILEELQERPAILTEGPRAPMILPPHANVPRAGLPRTSEPV